MIENEFKDLQKKARLRLLQLHYEAQCGHLGSNLSCIDMLLYLHHIVMKPEDIFILSKGHSAGALYVVLWTLGKLADDDLKTFHKDGTYLCSHITEKHGIFGTGSLGHGLSLATGMAIADKITNTNRKIYCLLSDGELEEGSTLEALNMLHDMDNLFIIIDYNKWRGFDSTHLAHHVISGSGHNFQHLEKAFSPYNNKIVFRTIKGNNTCYADKLESHYLPLTETQYKEAIECVLNS